jgi:cyclophilin family peptidyl-prolyl cis-trans isomerase/HEAT repeat protein
MKRFITIFITLFLFSSVQIIGQVVDFKNVPMEQMLQIVQAEDELRFDKTLETLVKHPNPHVRRRAILAAGRIGDKDAIPLLADALEKDLNNIRQMAAFAIGEIESPEGAEAILKALSDRKLNSDVRSRAIEAAGKIAATDRDNEKSKLLGKAIVDDLEFEARRRNRPSAEVILLGVTAVLRARPEGAETTVAKFLGYKDWRIRADALNTLARLQAKNVNDKAGDLLISDENPIVRANAVRVLGTAGHEAVWELILDKAINDKDLRVRINAIRALSGLKKKESAGKLIERAEKLFTEYKNSKYENPAEENELLTIASTLGNILRGTDNPAAIKFLEEFRKAEKHTSPEIEIALVRVSPETYAETKLAKGLNWQSTAGFVAGLGESANLEEGKSYKKLQTMAKAVLSLYISDVNLGKQQPDNAFPSILGAYAQFKTEDLTKVLRDSLKHDDVIIRSTAASLLGDAELEKDKVLQNYFALTNAFGKSQDDKLNDATLASLDAIKKQYEKLESIKTIKIDLLDPIRLALRSPDYLVRRKAFEIFKELKITPEKPGNYDQVTFKPGAGGLKTRVVRTDYKRALSRKNGQWGATLKTAKGDINIEFFPEEAPLTVDNFIKLAEMKYFDGLAIHRVVPNFVVQDGDPRGDGSGGPGWHIRCEINQIPYKRGMVGMALSGKDTGGSQWFVTHSPQPHLDGGYTIFGEVNEKDMKIVDNLARGDKILSVKIFRLVAKRVAK